MANSCENFIAGKWSPPKSDKRFERENPATGETIGSFPDSGPADTGPSSSGAIVQDTFLMFEGQRYELSEVLQADLVSDQFTEVGTASEADIDYEGELKVYTRSGDDAAVYTYSLAVDGEGEEGDAPATWAKWEPSD